MELNPRDSTPFGWGGFLGSSTLSPSGSLRAEPTTALWENVRRSSPIHPTQLLHGEWAVGFGWTPEPRGAEPPPPTTLGSRVPSKGGDLREKPAAWGVRTGRRGGLRPRGAGEGGLGRADLTREEERPGEGQAVQPSAKDSG